VTPIIDSGVVMFALARALGPYQQILIPEADFGGGICDLLAISRAGYATEYEVKVSLSDWNADRNKDKWKSQNRRFVKRFVYAIAPQLEHKIPDWLTPDMGVVVVDRLHSLRVIRTGTNNNEAPKVPGVALQRLLHNCYSRLWTNHLFPYYRERAELYDTERRAAGDTAAFVGEYEHPELAPPDFTLEGRAP